MFRNYCLSSQYVTYFYNTFAFVGIYYYLLNGFTVQGSILRDFRAHRALHCAHRELPLPPYCASVCVMDAIALISRSPRSYWTAFAYLLRSNAQYHVPIALILIKRAHLVHSLHSNRAHIALFS